MLLYVLQCPGWPPTTRIICPNMSIMWRMRNPVLTWRVQLVKIRCFWEVCSYGWNVKKKITVTRALKDSWLILESLSFFSLEGLIPCGNGREDLRRSWGNNTGPKVVFEGFVNVSPASQALATSHGAAQLGYVKLIRPPKVYQSHILLYSPGFKIP